MMKYVVCGSSVEDVQNGVEAMKLAIASGARCGVGGSTMAEVEKNLGAMKQMVSGATTPTLKTCSCSCPRSISGRELLNMIESAKSCEAVAGGNPTIHDLILGNGDAVLRCECEDEEDIGYSEGYMAMNEYGEALSCLCDSPEEAMTEAISNGYDLDEIGIYDVRAYDDDSVEVVNTIHRPTK